MDFIEHSNIPGPPIIKSFSSVSKAKNAPVSFLFSFSLIILMTYSISGYLVDSEFFQEVTLKDFQRGEIYTFSCSNILQVLKNSSEDSTKTFDEKVNFTLIVLDRNQTNLQLIFMEGNFSQIYMSELDEIDLQLLSEITYVVVEVDATTGEIQKVKYPEHVTESYMHVILPYIRGYLVDKRYLHTPSSGERNLIPHHSSMKVRNTLTETNSSRILHQHIRSDEKFPTILESNNNSFKSLVDGVSSSTVLSQFISKDLKKVNMFQIHSETNLNFLNSSLGEATTIIQDSFVKIEESSEKIKTVWLDRALSLTENIKHNQYEENFDNFQENQPKNNQRQLKQVHAQKIYLTDIFGKKLHWEMIIDDLRNETSNFTTWLRLESLFDWKLCEGAYRPETTRWVKQTYTLKNIYEDVANEVHRMLNLIKTERMLLTQVFISEIYLEIKYLLSFIDVNFEMKMIEIKRKQSEYSNILRNGAMDSYVPDTYKQIFEEFNSTCRNFINQVNADVEFKVSEFKKLEVSYDDANDKANVLIKTNNQFLNLVNSTTVKNSAQLLNFTYFYKIRDDILNDLTQIKVNQEKLFKKINDQTIELNLTRNKMFTKFENSLAESLKQFNMIEMQYKINPTNNSFMYGINNITNYTLELAYRISASMNLTQFLYTKFTNINKTIPSILSRSKSFIDTTVVNFLNSHSLKESEVFCEQRKNVQINMSVITRFTIIQTPINISIPQTSIINNITNSIYQAKEYQITSKISMDASAIIPTSTYIVSDFLKATFILGLLYNIGYNYQKLLFYYNGTTSFLLTKNSSLWEKNTYKYQYRKCRWRWGKRSCWTQTETRWTDPKYIIRETTNNALLKSSFDKYLEGFLLEKNSI